MTFSVGLRPVHNDGGRRRPGVRVARAFRAEMHAFVVMEELYQLLVQCRRADLKLGQEALMVVSMRHLG